MNGVRGSADLEGAPLPDIPGGWTTREVAVAGHTFCLTLPAAPDAFLDDADVIAAHNRDGYMPYWGYLWPTSLEMAAAVLKHDWQAGLRVLEIGAGIGLAGLAGLAAGLYVTFSDYDPQAVGLALHNARQNGWTGAQGLLLDWRNPISQQFPIIFACDVIYELQNHVPILNVLDAMLADGGECWLADPARHQSEAFIALAQRRGYACRLRPLPREAFPGRPDGVTNLWVMRRA